MLWTNIETEHEIGNNRFFIVQNMKVYILCMEKLNIYLVCIFTSYLLSLNDSVLFWSVREYDIRSVLRQCYATLKKNRFLSLGNSNCHHNTNILSKHTTKIFCYNNCVELCNKTFLAKLHVIFSSFLLVKIHSHSLSIKS